MNSLEELNQFSQTEIEFTDQRQADVIFNKPSPNNSTLTVLEGQSVNVPNGIDIIQIINYEYANVSLTVDVSDIPGATVSWPVIPSVCTVTNPSTGVYKISGIRSVSIWNQVKNPNLNLDNVFFGFGLVIAFIEYFREAELGITKSKTWQIGTTVVEVEALSIPTAFVYSTSSETAFTGVPNIIDEGNVVGTQWTLTMTPTSLRSVSALSTTGTGGTFNYNSTTDVVTITGTKEQINNRLNGLRYTADFRKEYSWTVTYSVVNSQTGESDTKTQSVTSNITNILSAIRANETFSTGVSTDISNGPLITNNSYTGEGIYTMDVYPFNSLDVDIMSAKNALVDFTGSIDTLEGGILSVSSNGNFGVLGQPTFNSNTGRVQVYSIANGVWTFLQTLTASDAAIGDEFGGGVSLSQDGSRLVVGSPKDDNAQGTNVGAVYIFNLVNGLYVEERKLVIINSSTNEGLGLRLKINAEGNYIVTSTITATVGSTSNAGYVIVWRRQQDGTWFEYKLTESTPLANNQFGVEFEINNTGNYLFIKTQIDKKIYRYFRSTLSFALQSGSTITIPAESMTINASGDRLAFICVAENRARIYIYADTNILQEIYPESLTQSNSLHRLKFSPDGAILAVTNLSSNLGIEILKRTGFSWTSQTLKSFALLPSNLNLTNNRLYANYGSTQILNYAKTTTLTDDYVQYLWNGSFGPAMGTFTDIIAYAMISRDSNILVINNRIYTRNVNAYLLTQTVVPSDKTVNNSWVVESVAVDQTGNTIVLGGRIVEGGTGTRYVYVFVKSGSTWVEQTKFTLAAAGSQFGQSVSLSYDGNTLAVGAPYSTTEPTNPGRVYIYTRSGTTWTAVTNFGTGAAADTFGWDLELNSDGTSLVVGAPNRDISGTTNRGGFYVYRRINNVWSLRATITDDGDLVNGQCVSMSGDGTTIAIGSTGNCKIYVGSDNSWSKQATIGTYGSATDVALSEDGNELVLGNANSAVGSINQVGLCASLRRSGSTWIAEKRFYTDIIEGTRQGHKVSISSNGLALFSVTQNGLYGGTTLQHQTIFSQKVVYGSFWLPDIKTLRITGTKIEVNGIIDSIQLTSSANTNFDLIYKVTTPENIPTERNQKINKV
jgi:hypothetical protein